MTSINDLSNLFTRISNSDTTGKANIVDKSEIQSFPAIYNVSEGMDLDGFIKANSSLVTYDPATETSSKETQTVGGSYTQTMDWKNFTYTTITKDDSTFGLSVTKVNGKPTSVASENCTTTKKTDGTFETRDNDGNLLACSYYENGTVHYKNANGEEISEYEFENIGEPSMDELMRQFEEEYQVA